MKKFLLAVFTLMMLVLGFTCIETIAAQKELVVYVSPDGNDSAAGTESAPLRTVDGARQFVRAKTGTIPIRVVFRGGGYYMPEKGVTFTEKDSGTKSAPVTYEAYPGEDVVFSGAKALKVSDLEPVTDSAILQRLPETARDKVKQLDLKKYGINKLDPVSEACVDAKSSTNMTLPIYNFLLLDGQRQMLSQWPNGEQNYESFEKVFTPGSATSPGTFGYSGTRPSRWLTAKDAYIFCHPNNDYCSERLPVVSIDTFNRSITVSRGGQGFAESKMSRIWKAYNLLEEIDVPQEWYIDRETMILYYYPPVHMKPDSVIELACLKDNLLNFRGASFINIKNITLEATRYCAFDIKKRSHDISVTDCVIRNIGLNAFNIQGEVIDTSLRNWKGTETWYLDAPYNITIHNNCFYYIGHTGIYIQTCTVGDIVSDNIKITNNYFTQLGWFTGGSYTLSAKGNGINFANNLVHNNTGGGANMNGYSSKAKYNEIYNICRGSSDVGLLYSCFVFDYRDNEWAYNLLYDSVSKLGYGIQFSTGIYRDCCSGGTDIHHNIISDMPFGFTINGGHFNNFHDNVLMDIGTTAFNLQEQGERFGAFALANKENINLKLSSELPGYAKRFPDVYGLLEQGWNNSNYNTIRDNLANVTLAKEAPVKMKDYVIEKNYENAGYENFVDPEHMDFRLKADSPLVKLYPNALSETNFDINSIGPQNHDYKSKLDTSFVKLYPENGQTNVDNADCTLVWETALYADEYLVKVATDKNMENIIFSGEAPGNYLRLSELEAGATTYYWTVEAKNIRRKSDLSWGSDDEVFSFTTVSEEIVDLSDVELAIEKARNRLSTVQEGVNYREGAFEFINNAITEAENALRNRTAPLTKSEARTILLTLERKLEESADYLIINFVNIDISKGNEWVRGTTKTQQNANYGITAEVDFSNSGELKLDGDKVIFTNKEVSMAQPVPQPETQDILCFRAKIDTNKGWGGIAFKQAVDFKLPWTTPNYNLVITEEAIELQKTGSGYLDTVSSDGVFKSGQWHDFAIGAVDTMNGVRIIVMVDGNLIFDYTDTTNPLSTGVFSFYGGVVGYNFEVQPVSSLPSMPERVTMKELDITQAQPQANNMATALLEKNTLLNFSAVMNTSGNGQAFAIGNCSEAADISATESYGYVVRDDVIYLRKYSEGSYKLLAAVDNTFIKSGEEADIRIGTLSEYGVTRVLMYVDGKKVFDYTDEYNDTEGQSFAAYDLNGSGIKISQGKGIACNISETDLTHYGVTKRWGTAEITPEKTEVTLTSHFTATKMYYWHEVMEDGDPNAVMTLMLDLDDQQFGEEEYITIPVDFTRGETGWKLLYVSDVKKAVLTTQSSGKGRIPQNQFLGRKSAFSTELVEFDVTQGLTNAVVFAADADIALVGQETASIGSKAKMVMNQMLIPADAVATVFNAEVTASADLNTVTVNKDGVSAVFNSGKKEYTLNSEAISMKIAPAIYDGVFYIPLEGICKVVGKQLYNSSYGLTITADSIPENYRLKLSDVDIARKLFLEAE